MAIFGAEFKRTRGNEADYEYDIIGKNSEVFTDKDLLTKGANGLEVAGPGDPLYGVKAGSETMASDNETVAKVEPAHIPLTNDIAFLMGTNADLNILTSPGTYYDIIGATGTQQVDVAGGAQTGYERIVECVAVDPFEEGDLRKGLFKLVQVFNFQTNNN